MKRKAILIESSDVKGHTDLPGARVDIANWELFLRSDYGGGWTDSEIVILRKPFSADVEKALDQPADCYSSALRSHQMAFLNRTKQNNCARDRQGDAEYKGGADSPTHEQSKAESQESRNCDLDDGSG